MIQIILSFIMYNGTIHDTVITPRLTSSMRLDKKADLNELSHQMKLNIAQLKSLLGIKNKDGDFDLGSIEELSFFGKSFNSVLDHKEEELRLLQNDISKLHGLYLKNKSYPSPRRSLSSPSTPRKLSTSLMLESSTFVGIPSKSSAFSPRFSTSSLPGKDLEQRELEFDMSLRKFSRESENAFTRSSDRLSRDYELRRKSSSSQSSSLKSSPRNLQNRDSNLSLSQSSSNKRKTSARSFTDIAENSTCSSKKSQNRPYVGAQRPLNKTQIIKVRSKSDSHQPLSGNTNNNNHERSKQSNSVASEIRKPQPRKQSGPISLASTYVDTSTNDDVSSSDYDESSLSTDPEEPRTEHSLRSSGRKKIQQTNKSKNRNDAVIKFEEVERKLSMLQQRCDLLENENDKIKKEQHAKNNKKIVDLKHQNSQLVSVARRLEQKAKALQLENNKKTSETVGGAQDLIQQKKTFAKLKSRMETEHSRAITEKEHQIETLKKQIDDLKKALRQSNNIKFSQGADDTLASSLRLAQKESLQLQKLAAAGNKKVTIRSLSMPVTARQKILEESNRNLRRQLSQLEEKYRQACNGSCTEDLKIELEDYKQKYENLEKESKEAKLHTVNLESELQIAKVESSDTNLRLSELKNSFSQLEEEYNTVHEQLSVAIKERDAAIKQCKESATKINEMELCIKSMDNHVGGGGDNGKWTKMNNKAASQYQIALEKLQAKIAELEKQCHEQNETNRLLNEQLIKLMKSSTQTSPVDHEVKETTHEVETELSPYTQVHKLPTFTTELEAPALPVQSAKINANNVNGIQTGYHEDNKHQLPRNKAQHNVGGNEDTEVEDFLEEELTQTMDHNDGGKLRVYIAKYTYNPYEGPNDSPEAELPLVAGDYVYVYGSMDEDGFFEGELMNGRRGLVPSNFLEPVHDDGHNMMNGKSISKADNSGSARCTSSEISQSESIISSCTSVGSGRISQRGDVSDSNMPVQIHGVLPYPKKLRIDKQLSHSLIISWIPPQLNEGEAIDEYHVFVNSEFKTAVNGKKHKAVVENIRHDQPYRISVCTVSQWGISDENICVLSHGRGADLAPTSIRMEKVGASSARVAWTPSSSQQCHIVSVEEEGTERFSPRMKNPPHMSYTVSPPAYRFTFGNLRPNIHYKVVVNVKGSPDEPRSFTRFKTPEAGPPDPPLSVQIEECQNSNYLLITWLPVTLNTLGTSNGVVVKGYGIHVGDTKVCDVQSPTIDQCTIRTQTLADAFGKQLSTGPDLSFYRLSKPSKSVLRWNKHVPPSITIKTYAVNGQESDHSDPCIISQELYNQLIELIKEHAKLSSPKPSEAKGRRRPPLMRSVESTDLDVSFSSDISMPGLSTPRLNDGAKENRRSGSSNDGSGYRKSNENKTGTLLQTRVVPSIEITHDTSSEEDPVATNGLGSRSSSTKSLGKRHFHKENSNATRTKNNVTENHKSSYKNSDNDDAVSISSSHTSSSTGGGDSTKHKKSNSVAHRAARAIQTHKLQRGESAEYSNSEDYMPFNVIGSRKNLNPPETEKRSTVHPQSPEYIRKQQHRHHHNIRHTGKRPHSVTSDEHSQGSHHSQSSSRHGHGYLSHGRPTNSRRNVIRQSTMSSQSGSELASEIEPVYPVDKSKVSLYVALYSYDPQMMSPNTDTFDEELSFTEGQLIKIYGTKDDDGFYYGETHTGNLGYIPCNMVSEVEVENIQMLNDLYERGHLPSASPDEDEQSTSETKTKSGASQVPNGSDEPDSGKPGGKTRYFVALFDYDPTHLSPNIDVDVEISFRRDDIIIVEGDMDDDGFYKGRLRDKEGLVPSNFLEEITEEQAISLKQKSDNKPEKKSVVDTSTNSILSPVPKPIPRPNHSNATNLRSASSLPSSYSTTSNNVNPNRVDNAVSQRKKGSFISKGKKLFKKLGGSQDGKHRR
uniref:peripheral-type benzodiazepine receptor-associated protein 1-like isoform X1 n=2 Tax=Styela clava TaxID=7725 RepID=UPI0019397B34|nr:peripheral-type benzodiazepine receptor-associated protein 1-like isoform X1 [Styela clava]